MKEIIANDVYFGYDEEFILKKISFTIQEGDGCVLLVGRNGAGKSTLINVLCGVLKCDEGEIIRKGMTIGYLPFDSPLYKHLTILENLRYFYRCFQGKNIDLEDRFVKKVVQRLSIDYLHQRFDKCSSGQQQKAGIACILLSGADMIIMDEPFVAIDSRSAVGLISLIREMKEHTVILLTTHTIDKLQPLANRLLLLQGKSLIKDTCNVEEIKEYFHEDETL